MTTLADELERLASDINTTADDIARFVGANLDAIIEALRAQEQKP